MTLGPEKHEKVDRIGGFRMFLGLWEQHKVRNNA